MSKQKNSYCFYIKFPETGHVIRCYTNINFVMSFADWIEQMQRKKIYNSQGLWVNPFGTDESKTGVLKFICGET